MAYYQPRREQNEPIRFIWCKDCEAVIMKEAEINDVALDFAMPHTLCQYCFQAFLERNFAADG